VQTSNAGINHHPPSAKIGVFAKYRYIKWRPTPVKTRSALGYILNGPICGFIRYRYGYKNAKPNIFGSGKAQNDNEVAESKIMIFGSIAITTNLTITIFSTLIKMRHTHIKTGVNNMKKTILLALIAFLSVSAGHAAEHHSGHGGGMGGGGGSGGACMKPKLAKFTPEQLATVAPGAEISFVALNINHPSQVSVIVKGIPVELNSEFKDPYYLFKAKLPDSLRSTVARVNIKVTAKSPPCEAEGGWLLKIGG
jgi:hypothetical protein